MDGAPVRGHTWVLLIYTVPATPTRKRAAVWREVKRLGALYLRDGVCALPDTDAARAGLTGLAERVGELGGQATVAREAQLDAAAAAALDGEWRSARVAEYDEVARAAADLLRHIQEESTHHAFGRAERTSLSGDLGRLERWLDQVVGRDYRRQGDPAAIARTLADCRAALSGQAA
jgi:hypothetical protein